MWNSLRVRLTIIFIGLAIGPLALVGGFMAQQGFATGQEQALDVQRQVAQRVTAEIGVFLGEIENNLQLIGGDIRNLETADRSQQMSILLTALNSGPYRNVYEHLALLDADGHEHLAVSRQGTISTGQAIDRSGTEAFAQTTASHEAYFGPVQFDETTGQPLIEIAIPLFQFRSVELSGVLVARLRLSTMQSVLRGLQLNEEQSIYILDSEGRVVAFNGVSVSLGTIAAAFTADEGTREGLSGTAVLFAANLIPLGDHELVVVAERATADALSLVQNGVYVSMFVTVLALLAAVGLVMLTVWQVVRPIEKLSAVARAIQQGDISTRATIRSKDEVGQLAHAFNEMVDTLQQRERDLKIAQRIADENSRLKSEFLATMSHELRTPMNAIEGFTSIMLSRMGGVAFNDKAERYITRVNVNSKRLLQLINDFLDLSRVESGRLEFAHLPFAPAELAQRWQAEIGVLAESKHLDFDIDLDPNLPDVVYGDEEAISKVAINLLSNAIKFTEQGKVSLALKNGGQSWRIIVGDTGIGIPPHAREFVFEEFRQVDQTSKRKYGGTGLGLAIVNKYVRTMGGTVSLQSEVGEGTTFTVTLPLDTQAHPVEHIA